MSWKVRDEIGGRWKVRDEIGGSWKVRDEIGELEGQR